MIAERIRLDGRVAVVAGAGGGGIGSQTVRALAEAGAHVVAVDLRAEPLDELDALLGPDGITFTRVVADATTDDGVAEIAAAAAGAPGVLHGLVNVIGGALAPDWGASTEITRDAWHDTLRRNLDTTMFVSQAVARELIARGTGGSIVCLSSTSGIGAAPFHLGYGVAKGAITALVRSLAVEWAPHGVRVNAIAPGTIRTPRAGADPGDAARDRRGVPMGRRGAPDEIAAAALFLVSDLSSYVTGQTLAVDGGTSVKHVHLGDDNVPIFLRNEQILARVAGEAR
jgi:NAD(P)-dependent dehydrogenase (short-subunit alcohol dehydrogenase family)